MVKMIHPNDPMVCNESSFLNALGEFSILSADNTLLKPWQSAEEAWAVDIIGPQCLLPSLKSSIAQWLIKELQEMKHIK